MKLLKPHGVAAAREICFRLRQQYPGIRSLVDLVEAYLLLESGSTAEARAIADRLDQESTLPTYDLTRLLVHCELGAGAGAAAIGRMQRMWQRRINPVHTGLELLPFLILAARVPEAMAVCRELEARVPGVPLLKQVRLTLDQMKVGLKAVPQYRLAQNGLIQPDGNTAVVSDGVTGHIDAVHVEDWCVFIAGWAVDHRARRSVNRVVVMLDGHAQGTATPSIKRADVAMALQLPEVEVSGFLVAVRLPDAALPSPPNLRVFVIAGDGAAHELAVPHTR